MVAQGRELFSRRRALDDGDGCADECWVRRGPATRLFDTRPLSLSGIGRNFDASPDGSRFLMTKDLQPPADAKRLIVVQNWFEELKRLVPLK